MEPYKPEYLLLSIGRGGLTGLPRRGKWGKSTCSIPDNRLVPYLGDVAEGGYAVDLRPALGGDDCVSLALNSPMADVDLSAGEVDRCPMPSALLTSGLGGAYGTLATLKRAKPKWTGLDSVSIVDWLEYWRPAGAKIGQRQGERVLWEDGTETIIPPAELRYRNADGSIRYDA